MKYRDDNELLYVLRFFTLRGALLLPSLYEFCGQVLRKTMFECHVTLERIFQKFSKNIVEHRVTLHPLPGLLACRFPASNAEPRLGTE